MIDKNPEQKTVRLSLYLLNDLDKKITKLQDSMEKETFFPTVSRSQFVSMLIESGLEKMTEVDKKMKAR